MNKSQYEPYKPEESCDGKLFWSLSEPEAGAPWKMCAGIKKIEIIWDYHITTPRSHNEDLEQCLGSILKLEDKFCFDLNYTPKDIKSRHQLLFSV